MPVLHDYNMGICPCGLRKFSDLGTDLVYFENIAYFSRYDVNTYQHERW